MGIYDCELVGESNYQAAVRRLRVGETIELRHEPQNKHDDQAVVAIDPRGGVVGYLPRDGWLTRVIVHDGTDVVAVVAKVVGGERGKPSVGVVLEVATAKDAEPRKVAMAARLSKRRGCLFG